MKSTELLDDTLVRLFDSMEEGVAVVGWDYTVRYANPSLRKVFGAPGGRKCHEYFPCSEAPCGSCPNDEIRAGGWSRQECSYPRIGKRFQLTQGPLLICGGVVAKFVIFREIPPQARGDESPRQGEVDYRQIVHLAQEGIWAIDSEARTTFVNPRMAQMLKYSPEEMVGMSLFEFMDEPHAKLMRERIALRRAGVVEQYDFEFLRKDGTSLQASLEAAPIYGPDGSFVGAFACVADISRRKAAEEALRKSQAELEIKNRISEIFLSVPDDEMYAAVLRVVLEALESKYGLFGYIDDDGAMVCPSLSRDVWDRCKVPDKSIVFPKESRAGIWGRALNERITVCANKGPLQVPAGHIPLERALCVPIIYRDQLVGLLAVANKDTEYVREDISRLEGIASKVAAILQPRLQRDKQYRARRRAEEALAQLQRQLRAEQSFAGIVGRDPKMIELFQTIREVAMVDVPVLIEGESGTGKELVAAAIHSEGPRADKAFVPVNCSALPEALLESELFGHVKGAFTGAIRDKKGRFELADGGTIFLDEVGDLSPSIQVSLLRVLQEGTIERVGDEKIRKVDVRVVSATNKDLRALVASGKFREDLFYRLCVVPVRLPPLRERGQDILLLAEHILKQVCSEIGRQISLSPEIVDVFLAHDWPGNVRELQNAIYYAAVKCKGSTLDVSHFPPEIAAACGAAQRPKKRGRKQKLDAERVKRALESAKGNKQHAARTLGVSRATLYKFLRRPGS